MRTTTARRSAVMRDVFDDFQFYYYTAAAATTHYKNILLYSSISSKR